MKRILLILGIGIGQAVAALAADSQSTDPSASSPPVTYRSALEGYRPFREEPIGDWKALNAEVGAAGGHVGIMGGAGGHGGGAGKPAQGKPVVSEGGQAPVRGAPSTPGGKALATPSGGAQSPKASAGGAHSQH